MSSIDPLRAQLTAAVNGTGHGRAVAERLCVACVDLLGVDGAAVSVMYDGTMSRSFGASGPISRELDEMQFTLGEGPCIDAVAHSRPTAKVDLDDPADTRWPGFTSAALERGMRAVFALPVFLAASPVGALDLYRSRPGELDDVAMGGALLAAELAALPLLDLMGLDLNAAVDDESSDAWDELTNLTSAEVYQAAGMVIAQLRVDSAEALVRIRAYAYAHDMTANQVAQEIIGRRLRLPHDDHGTNNGGPA